MAEEKSILFSTLVSKFLKDYDISKDLELQLLNKALVTLRYGDLTSKWSTSENVSSCELSDSLDYDEVIIPCKFLKWGEKKLFYHRSPGNPFTKNSLTERVFIDNLVSILDHMSETSFRIFNKDLEEFLWENYLNGKPSKN